MEVDVERNRPSQDESYQDSRGDEEGSLSPNKASEFAQPALGPRHSVKSWPISFRLRFRHNPSGLRNLQRTPEAASIRLSPDINTRHRRRGERIIQSARRVQIPKRLADGERGSAGAVERRSSRRACCDARQERMSAATIRRLGPAVHPDQPRSSGEPPLDVRERPKPDFFSARTKRQILIAGSSAARRLPRSPSPRPRPHFAGAAAPGLRRVHSSRS